MAGGIAHGELGHGQLRRRRGPRGDIDQERILRAAERLLTKNGDTEGISLRGVAAEVGVSANSIYTYFPSLDAIWHDLADERMGMIGAQDLVGVGCPHCAIVEISKRGAEILAIPGTLSLFLKQPVLGPGALSLSEALLELTQTSTIGARNAHDMLVSWFYGVVLREDAGWDAAVDELDAEETSSFPRILTREPSDQSLQFEALLKGMGQDCTKEAA